MNRHQRRALMAQGKWLPMERSFNIPRTPEQLQETFEHSKRLVPDYSDERIWQIIQEANYELREVYRNDKYTVHVIRFQGGPGGKLPIVQLSIKRNDRAPLRDWRDFQRIKNDILGPEIEGIELYPAESRLVDTATQFHIWCVNDPNFRFPFGWHQGRVVTGEAGGGAVQRPLDEV